MGDWWPLKPPPQTSAATVFEVPEGREVSRLEDPTLVGVRLSDDGSTLITKHKEQVGRFTLRCWHLPLRPPLFLVGGIPVGIGLLLALAWWLRARRRARGQENK